MNGAAPEPRIAALGDAAVLVELGSSVDLETNRRVRSVARRIVAGTGGLPGWGAPVPGACSVLVPVDPIDPGVRAAVTRLASLVTADAAGSDEPAEPPVAEDGPVLEIPTRYGGPDGPDLAAVAELTRLSNSAVVERHAGATYTTLFLGFVPGFGYLGPLPPELVVPRRPVPRTHVPAGSVAIAGAQTAIYPIESPGGWWLIGRTDAVLWDPRRNPPALLRAGARVRFVPAPGSIAR